MCVKTWGTRLLFPFTAILFLFQGVLAAQQITNQRTLPAYYTPGASFQVTLTIDVDEGNKPTGMIINETPPSGWQIISSTPTYSRVVSGTYGWEFMAGEVADKTISYTLLVPPTAFGTQLFNGVVNYLNPLGDPVSEPTGGALEILSTPLPHLAVAPDTLNFGSDLTSLTFSITNIGGSSLNWSASSTKAWLTLTDNAGSLNAGEQKIVTANVTRDGLLSGSHLATLTITSNGGESEIPVTMVNQSPSPIEGLLALPIQKGIALYWTNPSVYTGTIIFRKKSSPMTGAPVNGQYYAAQGSPNPELYPTFAGDATCIFKDTTGLNTFIDSSLDAGVTYYYKVYSLNDMNYSIPQSIATRAGEDGLSWFDVSPNTGIDEVVPGTPPLRNFRIFIPPHALQNPADIHLSWINPDFLPSDNSILGFANAYNIWSNISLFSGEFLTVTIPVYDEDLAISGQTKSSGVHVYHWPGLLGGWEELPIISRTDDTVTVRLFTVTGNDYFAIGSPVLPSGGGGGCFVATAAFGSAFQSHVALLREFRDTVLLRTNAGKSFVAWYYCHGPQYAALIESHSFLKPFVRVMLLPLVGVAWLSIKGNFFYALFAILLALKVFTARGRALKRET